MSKSIIIIYTISWFQALKSMYINFFFNQYMLLLFGYKYFILLKCMDLFIFQ